MKPILELLILFREYLASRDEEINGMCIHTGEFTSTLMTDASVEQREVSWRNDQSLRKHISDNQPDYMIEHYKQVDKSSAFNGSSSSDNYSDWKAQFTHPHMGYWWKEGDLQPRLDWLDEQINKLSINLTE